MGKMRVASVAAVASVASVQAAELKIKGDAIGGIVKTLKQLLKNSERDSKEKAELYDETACSCRDDMRSYTEQFEMAQKEIDRLDAVEEELTAKKTGLEKRIAKYKTSKDELEDSIKKEYAEKLADTEGKATNYAEETGAEQDSALEELKSINQPYLEAEIKQDSTELDDTNAKCKERIAKCDAMVEACDKVLTLMGESSSKSIISMVEKLRKHSFDRKTEMLEGKDECQAKIHDLEEKISSNQGFLELSIAASDKLDAELSETKAKLSKTQELNGDQHEIRKTAKKGVSETTVTCQKAAVQYDDESKTLASEIAGLTGAIASLQKVPAPAGETPEFIQFGNENLRNRVKLSMSNLASSAAVLHSSRLSAVALQMNGLANKPDYFVSIRNLIETMVTRLEDEQDAETSKSDWCAQSLQEMKGNKDTADTDHQSAVTLVKDTEAELVRLNGELTAEQKTLAGLESDLKELEKLMADKDSYYKALLEEKVAGEAALKDAIAFLQEIYGQTPTGDANSQRTTSGGSVIKLLEGLEADYTWAADQAKMETGCVDQTMFKDRKEQEIACSGVIVSADGANYESEQYKNKESKETLEDDITASKKTIDELETDIDTEKVNLEKFTDERNTKHGSLETAKEILKARQEACVNAGDSFEARKKRREEEIAALKDALTVLESHSKDAEENDMGSLNFLQKRRKLMKL